VRNSNVPGDEDGVTNGQMHVVVQYPVTSVTLEHIAAPYLFRLVDPLGGFASVTIPFTVVQKTYPQGVSGRLYDGNGQPLGNCVVVYMYQDQTGGAGAMSDATGHYTLYTPAGDFFAIPVKPGSVTDQSVAAVTVQSNLFTTRNATNLNAPFTLSGHISDISSHAGLPGLFVQAESDSGLFALGFTDTSGAFSIPVSDDTWKIKVNSDSGIGFLGYVSLGEKIFVDTSAGSVSNIDFEVPKATAMIYGTVRDNSSNAVTAMTISCQDETFTYQQSVLSDSTGRYTLPIFGGNWFVAPENSEATARGLFGDGYSVVVSNTQAVLQDVTLQRVTAHLRGKVISPNGTPISDVGVVGNKFAGQNYSGTSLYVSTQPDGTFDLGVYGGAWSVGLECSSATDRSLAGPNLTFNVTDGVDLNNVVLVAQAANYTLFITIEDNSGTPVTASAYASASVNGTNYNSCSSDNSGQQRIAVFPGTWNVGISGDMTSRGYDNPRWQTISVPADNLNRTLTLYPLGQTPPELHFSTFQNGHFQLTLNATSERLYRIEYTTSLAPPINWIPLQTNTSFGGTFQFTDPTSIANSGVRFYRSTLVP